MDTHIAEVDEETCRVPKFTNEAFFKTCINDEIKAASGRNLKMSLMAISISGSDDLKTQIPAEKLNAILDGIEKVIESGLRRPGDFVFKTIGEIFVLLTGYEKKTPWMRNCTVWDFNRPGVTIFKIKAAQYGFV